MYLVLVSSFLLWGGEGADSPRHSTEFCPVFELHATLHPVMPHPRILTCSSHRLSEMDQSDWWNTFRGWR